MSIGEKLSAGFDSVVNTTKNITAPGELDARGAADLITTVEAIKRGDPDAKLTRAEIKALAEINAQKVTKMKELFDNEAKATYSHEKGDEAKAREVYWEGYKAKLDAVIANYNNELKNIEIGAKEDLASIKKAHDAMIALKQAPAAQIEGKKSAQELFDGVKDKLSLLNGTGLDIKVVDTQLQVSYTDGPKNLRHNATNILSDGTAGPHLKFPLVFNNATRIDIKKESNGNVIIEEFVGNTATSRITVGPTLLNRAQTQYREYITKNSTPQTPRPLADVGAVSGTTDFIATGKKDGAPPDAKKAADKPTKADKPVSKAISAETKKTPTLVPTEAPKSKVAATQSPEKTTTKEESETKSMLARAEKDTTEKTTPDTKSQGLQTKAAAASDIPAYSESLAKSYTDNQAKKEREEAIRADLATMRTQNPNTNRITEADFYSKG